MLRSQLSILGLYNYDPEVFKGFRVPEGMDREVAIQEILMNCAELEIIYPSLNTMKLAIQNWTIAELPIWERALKDMTIEYNPIWNVDAEEKETIERELTGTDTASGSDSTVTGATTVESGKAYNQNNQAEWTERIKQQDDGTSGTESESERESTESEKITTTKTRGGNIGVTMTQQMLNADLDMLPRLNPYQFIVDSFKNRFCLLVY